MTTLLDLRDVHVVHKARTGGLFRRAPRMLNHQDQLLAPVTNLLMVLWPVRLKNPLKALRSMAASQTRTRR